MGGYGHPIYSRQGACIFYRLTQYGLIDDSVADSLTSDNFLLTSDSFSAYLLNQRSVTFDLLSVKGSEIIAS